MWSAEVQWWSRIEEKVDVIALQMQSRLNYWASDRSAGELGPTVQGSKDGSRNEQVTSSMQSKTAEEQNGCHEDADSEWVMVDKNPPELSPLSI